MDTPSDTVLASSAVYRRFRNHTPEAKAARKKYNESDKGKQAKLKYRLSEKGKAAAKRSNAKRYAKKKSLKQLQFELDMEAMKDNAAIVEATTLPVAPSLPLQLTEDVKPAYVVGSLQSYRDWLEKTYNLK